ncbi:inner nuclear membrane protein enriched at telomere/subtelomere region [Coemansia sp. RSA 1933]|nr:inner nuclear membrane protein enriched at telomere/subtelomere region [Coemansia sp. RSA 1933]
MSDNQYLEEGFDPTTLKVSSLRNILVKHEVEYPSNAKKSELVGLVEKKVLSKASKLRKEAKKQRRAVADGRDIEVVVENDMQTAEASSSVSGRTRAKKKPKKVKASSGAATLSSGNKEGDDSADAAEKQLEPKSTRSVKRKHSETEETEQESDAKSKEKAAKTRPADGRKQRMTKRRIRQEHKAAAAASSDESEKDDDDKEMKERKPVTATTGNETPKSKRARTTANFSDDNPFQSSPDTARKPRRKTPSKSETPMSALRKSQVSDLTFKVALPRSSTSGNEDEESAQQPMVIAEEEPMLQTPARNNAVDADDVFSTPFQSPFQQQQRNSRVGDLVARYQGQAAADAEAGSPRSPTVRIRDGLKRPSGETRGGRFTMTPDALRQMAAQQQHQQQDQHRRRTMATDSEASGLPPVAPRIPVPPVASKGNTGEQLHHYAAHGAPSIEEMESDAQALQRRRVATMRAVGEDDTKQQTQQEKRHSRRSSIASIASSVSEARGIPGIPTTVTAKQSEQTQQQLQGLKPASPTWAARLLAWVVIGASLFVLRVHQQFSIGFGSTRADLAPLEPPSESVLAMPQPIDMETALVVDRLAYYAKYARAAYLSPAPLACPEHAECVPYTAIPASAASAQADSAAARDQWVVSVTDAAAAAGTRKERRVSVVRCDSGYVLQFPALSTRAYPLVPECIRDLSTEHRVRQLVAAMLHECSVRLGRAQCDASLYDQARRLLARAFAAKPAEQPTSDLDDEADEIERTGIAVPELRDAMWARKAPRLSHDEFDALFRLALDELVAGDDVTHYVLEFDDVAGAAEEVQYFVAKTPEHSLACAARRLVLNLVLGNAVGLAALLAACVIGYVASRRLAAHRAELRAADALVVSALARLKRQARRHYADPALSPAPAIPSLQLRDMLLLSPGRDSSSAAAAASSASAYYDPRARTGVWERVRKVVERNANVRCRTTAVRGEPMRVWEWIGPLEDDADDDALFSPLASPFGSPLASPQRPSAAAASSAHE